MNQENASSLIAGIACDYVVSEFVHGMKDCRDGKPHQHGNGDSYDAGYNAEYQLEQILGAENGKQKFN